MSAGGSDNCTEEVAGRKIVHPQGPVGLSQVSPFQRRMLPEQADPQLRLQRPRNKQTARDVSGRRECVCQSVRGDGVKPKALTPWLYNAGMTGSL